MPRPRKQASLESRIAEIVASAGAQMIDAVRDDFAAQAQRVAAELRHSRVIARPAAPARNGASAHPVVLRSGDEQLRTQLQRLLAEHDNNITAVAREMGKERVQIRRWMKRFDLKH